MLSSIPKDIKIRLLVSLVVVFLLLFALSLISGCAIDIRGRATAFDARIDDTAQTSLVSGHRAARD